MKMADAGYRPAYNAQFATDTESQVIVGVEAATAGSDMGQLMPVLEQVGERCGQDPDAWLVDGGYPAHEQIEQAAERTDVYAPVPKPKDPATDPHARNDGYGGAIACSATAENRAVSLRQSHEASKPRPAVDGERNSATPPLRPHKIAVIPRTDQHRRSARHLRAVLLALAEQKPSCSQTPRRCGTLPS